MSYGHINYRVLYFFHGNSVAVLTAGITKETVVPSVEIDRAVERKTKFAAHPHKHGCDRMEGLK